MPKVKHPKKETIAELTGKPVRRGKNVPNTPQYLQVLDVEETRKRIQGTALRQIEENIESDSPDVRLLTLVAKPLFPNVNINLSGKLDSMGRDGLIEFIKNA